MWTYDWAGNLYFEKALGFLQDLFAHWQKLKCAHDVSIILFSRTRYPADVQEGDFDRESQGNQGRRMRLENFEWNNGAESPSRSLCDELWQIYVHSWWCHAIFT
jgi:hypothetical protein